MVGVGGRTLDPGENPALLSFASLNSYNIQEQWEIQGCGMQQALIGEPPKLVT